MRFMFAISRKHSLLPAFFVLLFAVLPLLAEAGTVQPAHPIEDAWVTKAPMPEATAGFDAAVVRGKIYAIGDFNEEYNPVTDTWSSKAPMLTIRSDFGIAVYNNKIYCIGGMTGFDGDTGFNATGATEVYDPTTDTWETKAPMPTPRFNLRATVANNKIYLIGGTKQDPPENITIPHRLNWGQQISDAVEVYDPETDTWTTKASIPNAVHSYASATIGNKIYIISSTSTWKYDTERDNWSQGASPPTLSVQAGDATSGVFAPPRIYIFGENTTHIYDPSTNGWTLGAFMPTNRNGPAVAVLDDKFYVIGGWREEPITYLSMVNRFQLVFTAANEEYTPVGYGTAPPEIMVLSPENITYNLSSIPLDFTVNKPTDWLGYTLDSQENVTIQGNTTISNLSNGLHTVTVYANDTFGNTGASEPVSFTINQPAPFPTVEVAAATIMIAAVASGLVYFRRRKPT
jgi:Kelch motif